MTTRRSKLTVGKLRRLLAKLPDEAMIWPDWAAGEHPEDHDPGVEVRGFSIGDQKGFPYLSVKVAIFYLNG